LLRDSGISLQALDSTSWPDREPLDTGISRIDRIDHQLLFQAIVDGIKQLPTEPPAWLARSGLLASGAIGVEAYRQLRRSVQAMLDESLPKFAEGKARAAAQAIDLDLGDGLHLTGTVDRVFHAADGGLMLFDAKPAGAMGLRELLAFYIDWAALRLTSSQNMDGVLLEHPANGKVGQPKLLSLVLAQTDDELRRGLRRLVDTALDASQQPLLFFPKTALSYASSSPEDRITEAARIWEGSDFGGIGERDYTPGYASLVSRGLDLFDAHSPIHHAFVLATQRVCDVLDPKHSMLLKTTAAAAAVIDGADV